MSTRRPCELLCGSIEVRAQRIGGEVLLPQSWRELRYLGSGMLADSLQYIDQVGVRIDVVQSAGDDEALCDADVLRTHFGPTEIPIFPPHRDHAQCALDVVGVHRYVGIGEKDFQSLARCTRIAQRFGKGIAGQ